MTKMSAGSSRKRLVASTLAWTLVATAAIVAGSATAATAQQSPIGGNAPFINTWLVSGPFDTAEAEAQYGIQRPTDGDWARVATVSASSSWKNPAAPFPLGTDNPSTTPAYAVDGDPATNWVSQMHDGTGAPSTWPAWDPKPTYTLAWAAPIKVKQIQVFDRHNASWPANTSDVGQVDYTLKDAAGAVLATGSITSIDATGQNPGVATLATAVTGVSKVELLIVHDGQKIAKNVGLGFKEVGVLDGDGPVQISGSITPVLGDEFAGGKEWEYFDDRIWNRNYDDYQDLSGYFTIKKGIDTKNKYVYAASYVYSATAKDVQLRYGSSGSHRVFVNDQIVGSVSTPAEVQKDMVQSNIHLNAGWNKILLQIKHSYTNDVNGNGVPVAQDASVSYLGFYARISDTSGNTVSGLTYGVTDGGGDLAIDTRGLSADDVVDDDARGRGLPTNVLPTGYQEWPYVWNVSHYSAAYGVGASKFRFLASGGTPGYTWSLQSGALPAGLTLNADGTVDGYVNATPGTYSFTVKVTDGAGATKTKELSITVKDRPNRWFELGRVSALSHCIPIYQWFVDPNYSPDAWAERAKRQGHSLVAVESLQQNYYWPSKFADPLHNRQLWLPKDANGKVVDGLKAYEEAVKRYGMKFGLYYASEGGGLQHNSSDVFVQNVEDLILRYDPSYFYFDGPQAMGNKNFDAMYSIVRNYSDEILIQANAQANEYGDVDLRTGEADNIFAHPGGSILTKRTINEPWKSIITKSNPTAYYDRRDDYRLVAKEMIMNAGRGMVDNNDQMPIIGRGPNWDTPQDIATRYPKALQEFVDIRENVAAWFAPEGKPERHESTTGTMPYFLTNSLYTDDGKGNIARIEVGQGPSWGYALSRDNNIYLHIIKGPDNKQGYAGNSLTISPVPDDVVSASWLNEDEPLSFTQSGDSVTIDLTGVERDPVDTIVKLVTDDPQRDFTLTNLVVTGKQVSPSTLQVETEGYMTYPALKTRFGAGDITYSSSNTAVATVSASGLVTAVGNGEATITVNGTYEGVTRTEDLNVKVASGKVYVKDDLIGASLWIDDREAYGEFSSHQSYDYRIEGRTDGSGVVGLGAATVTMRAGVVNLTGGTYTQPVSIQESDIVTFQNGQAVPQVVDAPTRVAVWAEVTLDGKTVTSNRVFMDLLPTRNMAQEATVTASSSTGSFTPDKVIDGKTMAGTRFDSSKWSTSPTGASWLKFALAGPTAVQNIEIHYNSIDQRYINTPKTMEIQTSPDGTTWTTVSTVTPPTYSTGAYFGFSDKYSVGATTRYVRLNFPQGGNHTALDIQEVKINGLSAPALHWKLDETSGTSAADSSASGNTGTVNGTAAWVAGKRGNALDLDGTTASVTGAAAPTTATDNITMSAWIKWDGATGSDQVIAYNGNSASNGYGILLRSSSNNRIQIIAGGSGYVASQVTPTVAAWPLVTAVRRSGAWELYVNGESVVISNATVTTRPVVGSWRVGAGSANNAFFNGAVDDVKLYESPLTQDEIRAAF